MQFRIEQDFEARQSLPFQSAFAALAFLGKLCKSSLGEIKDFEAHFIL
jgi:hypothetical protein